MSAGLARSDARAAERAPLGHDDAERLVLAGLAQGSLARSAIVHDQAPDLFKYEVHQDLLCVIEAVYERAPDRPDVYRPHRVERRWDRATRRETRDPIGISAETLVRAFRTLHRPFDGYIRGLYRLTPSPGEAGYALTVLRCRAAAEEDAAADRRRALRSLADLVPASLVALEETDLVEVLAMLRDRRVRLMGTRA